MPNRWVQRGACWGLGPATRVLQGSSRKRREPWGTVVRRAPLAARGQPRERPVALEGRARMPGSEGHKRPLNVRVMWAKCSYRKWPQLWFAKWIWSGRKQKQATGPRNTVPALCCSQTSWGTEESSRHLGGGALHPMISLMRPCDLRTRHFPSINLPGTYISQSVWGSLLASYHFLSSPFTFSLEFSIYICGTTLSAYNILFSCLI